MSDTKDERATWEKVYDKVIIELKTNLIYVLVLMLTYTLYKSEQSKAVIERAESERLVKDRDEWRNLATKAIKRNFNYVDILIHNYDKNSVTADSLIDTTGR